MALYCICMFVCRFKGADWEMREQVYSAMLITYTVAASIEARVLTKLEVDLDSGSPNVQVVLMWNRRNNVGSLYISKSGGRGDCKKIGIQVAKSSNR